MQVRRPMCWPVRRGHWKNPCYTVCQYQQELHSLDRSVTKTSAVHGSLQIVYHLNQASDLHTCTSTVLVQDSDAFGYAGRLSSSSLVVVNWNQIPIYRERLGASRQPVKNESYLTTEILMGLSQNVCFITKLIETCTLIGASCCTIAGASADALSVI
jgi:hypothetical protein